MEQKEIGKYQIINILRSIILGLLETASREIGERRGCLAGCEPVGMATGGCQTRVERARRVSAEVRARGMAAGGCRTVGDWARRVSAGVRARGEGHWRLSDGG